MSDRISTGFLALDRMLGGGLVPGSLVLLSGEIGAGKSTLALQMVGAVARQKRGAFYVSSEQDVDDILDCAERVGCGDSVDGMVAHESDLDEIVVMPRPGASLLVVDSLHSLFVWDMQVGSWGSIREAVLALKGLAVRSNIAVVAIGHAGRNGNIRDLRNESLHVADVGVLLSCDRETRSATLKFFKNRYGSDREEARLHILESGAFADVKLRTWRFFESVAAIFHKDNERLHRLWMMRSMAREAWLEAGGCEACGGIGTIMGGHACEAAGTSHAAGMDPMIVTLDDARVLANRWSVAGTFDRLSRSVAE